MKNKLKRLQDRIIKLEELKSELALADQFGQFMKMFEQIKISMEETNSGSFFASKVYPNEKYEKKVVSELKKVVRDAKKISKEISNDPHRVKAGAIEKKVTNMRLTTESASKKLKDIWEKEISKNVSKWVDIAIAVNDLGAKGGNDFKKAIDKLKNVSIPKTEEQIKKIQEEKTSVQTGISKLGLEGKFGEFLKMSAEGKAVARDLLDKEVRMKMEEYDLWDSFRVTIGR